MDGRIGKVTIKGVVSGEMVDGHFLFQMYLSENERRRVRPITDPSTLRAIAKLRKMQRARALART